MNTAADSLSRLDANPNKRKILKRPEDTTIKYIEVNIESTGISPEQPAFNTADALAEVLEHDFWQYKADIRSFTSSQLLVITMASYYLIDLPREPLVIVMAF